MTSLTWLASTAQHRQRLTNQTGTALSATAEPPTAGQGGTNDTLVLNAGYGFWATAGTVSNSGITYTVYQTTRATAKCWCKMACREQPRRLGGRRSHHRPGQLWQLIAPVQVEASGYTTGTARAMARAPNGLAQRRFDICTHDVLDGIFKYDINGNLTLTRHQYHRHLSVRPHQRHQCSAAHRQRGLAFPKAVMPISRQQPTPTMAAAAMHQQQRVQRVAGDLDAYKAQVQPQYQELPAAGGLAEHGYAYYWSATAAGSGHVRVSMSTASSTTR